MRCSVGNLEMCKMLVENHAEWEIDLNAELKVFNAQKSKEEKLDFFPHRIILPGIIQFPTSFSLPFFQIRSFCPDVKKI